MSFLTETKERVFKKKNKRGVLKKILLVLVLVLVVWIFIVLLAFAQFVSSSIEGVSALTSAKTEGYAFHFDSASRFLKEAEESFKDADKMYYFMSSLRPVPVVGKKVFQAVKLVHAGREATGSLSSVLLIGSDVLKLAGLDEEYLQLVENGKAPHVSFSDLSSSTKKTILDRLQASSKDLFIISKQIDVILSELGEISFDESLLPYLGELNGVQSELEELESTLNKLSLFAHVLPVFSGLKEEQTYLVLFLNNTELRPGGGFIGTYGLMRVKNGDLLSFDTEDVYALDDATIKVITEKAPLPLQKYNNADKWFFRDGNWSPDFEESSNKLIEQFVFESRSLSEEDKARVANSEKIDGVIGFTPTFASKLLEITGPISVGSQTFSSKNIADKLEYQVEFGFKDQGIPLSQRKEVLSDLVEKMIDKMFELPIKSWATVSVASQESLRTKQLLLFHSDETVQNVLTQVGWSGVIDLKTVDAQLVVDANLASLKSDPVVKREITYSFSENSSGQMIGKTKIVYNHTGSFDWKTSRYRTYVRLYVPEGSKFIRATGTKENDAVQNINNLPGTVDVTEELGFVVFGTFTSVEPGKTQELVFEYELSKDVQKAIKKGDYDLTVFKQPGADENRLTIDLDFGKNVIHAVPAEEKIEWGDHHFRLNTKLDQDQTIEVSL